MSISVKTNTIDEQVRMAIGKSYVEDSFKSENSLFVKMAYKEIARVNKEIFNLIPYKVVFTDEDTYTSAKEMRERVVNERVIYIYKGGSDHPFLTEEENWMGRAVHDVLAHMVCGCPFSFIGEYNAYLEQRKYYPKWTWKVLFAEIPAQTSAYYYSGGYTHKQRAIEAPNEWLEMCERFKTDYSKNSVFSLKAIIEQNNNNPKVIIKKNI